MKARAMAMAGLAAILLAAGGAMADKITIETVPVGDLGNAADTRYATPGYGSVGYAYNIGKYEVTAGQYTAFLNAVAKTDTYGLYSGFMQSGPDSCQIQRLGSSGSYTYSVASDYANRPVNWVSWGDATRFANWLHNGQPIGAQSLTTTEDGAYYLNGATSDDALLAVTRKADWKWAITSEDEWYKAAYYKGGGTNAGYWDYPTSSDTAPGRDMADASGNNANYFAGFGASYPIDSGKYTTVAGEFQNSLSPYGTFDQGGNVCEWNDWNWYGWRNLRGGSFDDTSDKMKASTFLFMGDSSWEFSDMGFRIVEVPEPASMAVLSLGGLAMIRRGRRTPAA
jgi:formylglycine-generating enzyme